MWYIQNYNLNIINRNYIQRTLVLLFTNFYLPYPLDGSELITVDKAVVEL